MVPLLVGDNSREDCPGTWVAGAFRTSSSARPSPPSLETLYFLPWYPVPQAHGCRSFDHNIL